MMEIGKYLGIHGKVYHQEWKNTLSLKKNITIFFDNYLIHKWLLTNNGNDVLVIGIL